MKKSDVFLVLGTLLWILPLGCDDTGTVASGSDGDTDTDTDGDSDGDSDADSDGDADGDADIERATITATLTVPDDFDADPQRIDAVFFVSEDFSVEPAKFGDTVHDPEIGPGTPFELEVGQAGLSGDYYMAVVLYCEGGGDGEDLVPGVDWVGAVDGPLSLDPFSGAVDAGTIELSLFEGME